MDALEVANAEHQVTCTQLQGMVQALNYPADVAYRVCIKNDEEGAEEREGTMVPERWETQEAGIATSKVPEDTKDGGEGLSRLNTTDKGKGKEKEIVEEETLQEE